MLRLSFAGLPILVATVVLALQGQDIQRLTETQRRIVTRVQEDMLAPCCWHESLAVHRSQIAVELRAEIIAMARSGMTEQQITRRLVERFGIRVLREPPGTTAGWLYLAPIVISLGGLVVLMRFIRRNLRMHAGLTTQLRDRECE